MFSNELINENFIKMENVKNWLDKKGYYNIGLRFDRNHRIDLYLSDVLEEYKTEQLTIPAVVWQSEQFSLSDIYKIAQNYTEEHFIEMVKHVQG